MRKLILLLCLGVSALCDGQNADTNVGSVVRGRVYDSVANRALAGAVIQALSRDSSLALSHRAFTAVADSDGAFIISALPAGSYIIGFQHQLLNALDIEALTYRVTVSGRDTVTLSMPFPTGPSLRTQLCPDIHEDPRNGLLVGVIVDSRTNMPLDSGAVVLRWPELTINENRISRDTMTASSHIGRGGRYLLCALPSETTVSLSVEAAGYTSLRSEMELGADATLHRDFILVQSTIRSGIARLKGHVTNENGSPLLNGTVTVSALGRSSVVDKGVFTISDLPAGTWRVDFRSVGYQPQSRLVDLSNNETTEVLMILSRAVPHLTEVHVVAKRGDQRVLSGIDERMRVANGTVFLEGNSWLAGASVTSDVLRAATGFSYVSPTIVKARPFGMAGRRCESSPSSTTLRATGTKEVAIYLDGVRQPGGLESVNNMVLPRQVLAVEAYPDVISAPFLWRTNDACAVVAIWTKH